MLSGQTEGLLREEWDGRYDFLFHFLSTVNGPREEEIGEVFLKMEPSVRILISFLFFSGGFGQEIECNGSMVRLISGLHVLARSIMVSWMHGPDVTEIFTGLLTCSALVIWATVKRRKGRERRSRPENSDECIEESQEEWFSRTCVSVFSVRLDLLTLNLAATVSSLLSPQ